MELLLGVCRIVEVRLTILHGHICMNLVSPCPAFDGNRSNFGRGGFHRYFHANNELGENSNVL